MLALLLLRANTVVSRAALIEALWPSSPPPSAEHAVHVYVSQLRKLLGSAGRLSSAEGGYVLRVDEDELDAARFARLADEGRARLREGDATGAAETLRRALTLWRGDVLGELGDELFASGERNGLEERRLQALGDRIDAELELGRHADVVTELEALVAQHPLHERFTAQLMLALYRLGRQADALAAYRKTRARLVDELGLEPGPELRELERRILRQDPSLAVEPPEVRARRHLPAPPTPLVGRRDLVDRTKALLRGDVRLLTLTGPGGSGKTRVALAAASELAADFRDGVYFVDLAPLEDARLVAGAIGRSVGVDASTAAEVSAALRDRSLLLLADNFEHVDPAATVLAEVIRGAGTVRVLVTSRGPLRLYGEHVEPIPPLRLDEEAVPLFVARARAVGAAVTASPAVADICRRLDCLPLALELAAARARELTVPEILAALERPLDVSSEGPRDFAVRQQTLREAIAWSVRLLDELDRELFGALAVFVGSWSDDAAAAVTGAGSDSLARLVDRSLVVRVEKRFAMLATIREYALEQLAARPEADELRRRHAEYYLRLAEDFGARAAEGVPAAADLDAVEQELGNLRATRQWLRSSGKVEVELRLLTSLRLFHYLRGYSAEAASHLAEALDAARGADPELRADALHAAIIHSYRAGDYTAAKERSQELLALSREVDDALGTARALGELGAVAAAEGDYRSARSFYTEAAEYLRALGDTQRLATALGNLGDIALNEQRFDDAERLLEESVALAREANDPDSESTALFTLARTQLERGRPDAARAPLLQALRTATDLGYREVIAYCIASAAEIGARERSADAARLVGAAEAAFEALAIPMQGPERAAYERTVASLESELGSTRFAELRGAGRSMALDEAAAVAAEICTLTATPARAG